MMRSHKLGLAVVAATAMSLLATGCTASTPSTSAAPVTLTFWGAYGNGGNSTQQDALNKTLIPAFEKANAQNGTRDGDCLPFAGSRKNPVNGD